MSLNRFRPTIYVKDSVFLFEEPMAKGAKKDSKHIQAICSFILNKERAGLRRLVDDGRN
jgi:hypothetical protein